MDAPRRPSPHAAAIVLAMAVLVLAAGIARPDAAVGPEGLVNLAVIAEIRHGVVPPTSPYHLGAPAVFGWGWHLGLAAVVDALRVPASRAAIVVGAVAAGWTVASVWTANGLWTRRPWLRAAFTVLPFALAAPWRAWWWALRTGASADGGLFAAFLGTDPRPTGVALAASGLVLLGRAKWDTRARALAAMLASFLCAVVWWPAVLALAMGSLGALIVALVEHGGRGRLGVIARQAAPGIAVLCTVGALAPWIGSLPGERFVLVTGAVAAGRLVNELPVIVMIGVGFARWRRLQRPARQLTVTAAEYAVAAAILDRHDGAAVVFALALGIIGGPLALALLGDGFPGWRSTSGAGASRRDRLALVAFSAGVLAIGVDVARVGGMSPTGESAALAAAAHPSGGGGANHWLRSRSPRAAVVLTAPERAIATAALAERRVVAAPLDVHTLELADHVELLARASALVDGLAACAASPASITRLAAMPEPWPPSLYALVARPPSTPSCAVLPPGVSRVYEDAADTVYVVRIGAL